MTERITHAAIRGTGGMIFLGKCHADCFLQARNTGAEIGNKADDQGFFTSAGRFVDRKEAMEIAVRAFQVSESVGRGRFLLSEDLWDEQHGGRFKYDSIKGYHE